MYQVIIIIIDKMIIHAVNEKNIIVVSTKSKYRKKCDATIFIKLERLYKHVCYYCLDLCAGCLLFSKIKPHKVVA